MLKHILTFEGAQELNNDQKKTITGGGYPDIHEFCCGSEQDWWLGHYPNLNERYNCDNVNCEYNY